MNKNLSNLLKYLNSFIIKIDCHYFIIYLSIYYCGLLFPPILFASILLSIFV